MKRILKTLLFLYLAPLAALDFNQRIKDLPNEIQYLIFSFFFKETVTKIQDTWVDLNVLRGHEKGVKSVAFNHEGTQLASASADKTIRLWNPLNGWQDNVLRGHENAVNSVAFDYDGTTLASGSADKTVSLWDPRNGKLLHILRDHEGSVNSVAFNHNGTQLASASNDTTVRVWDPLYGKLLTILAGHLNAVTSVAFSHDGSHLASASDDHTIRLWNPHKAQAPKILRGHFDPVNCLVFNHDSSIVISASASVATPVMLWNVGTGHHLKTLWFDHNNNEINFLSFNYDGSQLASARISGDRTICLRDPKDDMKKLHILSGHDYWVSSLAFSHDGTVLASGSADKTVCLWGDSKKIISNFFKELRDVVYYELVWLLKNYKDLLKEKYPQRTAIRIQDVATFARNIHKKTDFTVEKMTRIAKELPLPVRRALVRNFHVYSCSDIKFKEAIKTIRRKTNR